MKYIVAIMVLCVLIALITGCSGEVGNGGADEIDADTAATSSVGDSSGAGEADAGMADDRPDEVVEIVAVDVDMAAMSSTMAQAKFFSIFTNPMEYLGQTIRASGPYFSFYFDELQNHFVMIVPGDACCRLGFEFRLPDTYVYPDDFPAQYTPIEITGVLSRYEAHEQGFIYLAVDEIILMTN
ncbi:MAG: hypothetical protein FWC66_07380 [Oscillospiraceae bacterium]|nr:hypothetical protein [Oscillospiraceae bacterium]